MTKLRGPAEVTRLKQRLDDVFARAHELQRLLNDPTSQIHSDFAKYVCVALSGYLEQSISELVLEGLRRQYVGRPQLQRYVEARFTEFRNPKTKRILDLLNDFDASWYEKATAFLVDERKDAVDSVVNIRNNIAHGADSTATIHQMRDYQPHIESVVRFVETVVLA